MTYLTNNIFAGHKLKKSITFEPQTSEKKSKYVFKYSCPH